MTVKIWPGYTLQCDFPGCDADPLSGSDFAALGDLDSVLDSARDGEWLITDDGGHWCRDHVVGDEFAESFDGEEVDTRRGMEPTLENQFILAMRNVTRHIDRLVERAIWNIDGDRQARIDRSTLGKALGSRYLW